MGTLLTGHSMAEEAVIYPALAQAGKQGHANTAYTEQVAHRAAGIIVTIAEAHHLAVREVAMKVKGLERQWRQVAEEIGLFGHGPNRSVCSSRSGVETWAIINGMCAMP